MFLLSRKKRTIIKVADVDFEFHAIRAARIDRDDTDIGARSEIDPVEEDDEGQQGGCVQPGGDTASATGSGEQ